MNRQREVIYGERRAVLEGADLHLQVREMIDAVVEGYVVGATDGFPEEWDLDALWQALKQLYPVTRTLAQVEEEAGGRNGLTREELVEDLKADAQAAYDRREQEFGEEVMRELERRVVLSVLDRKWREHLYEMDYLREGIGLRAYSQRDPLVEYQREGFDMFAAMMDGIKEESVGYLFNLEVQVEPDEPEARSRRARRSRRRCGRGRSRARPGRRPAPPAATGTGTPRPIRAEGPRGPEEAGRTSSYSAPSEDGDGEVSGAPQQVTRRPVRRRQPQRRVPLRLGQEVQEVPRRAGRAHGPDHPRQRLTRLTRHGRTRSDTEKHCRYRVPLALTA